MSNSWVEDFNSFQGSQGNSVVVPGKIVKRSPTKAEAIEAELKLLEWHKMANDAAMKAALVQTKAMKATDHGNKKTVTPQFKEDDKRWMRKVINEENAKPLEVSRDFVLDYERREKENSERLSSQVEQHIHTLRNLRGKLEQRVDLKSRTDEYREFQREFKHKKNAVLEGKTIEEFSKSREMSSSATGTGDVLPPMKKKPTSDLSHVLNSLSRLSELEGRISKLESGNIFDNLVDAEENPKVPESVHDIDFKKKRTMGQGAGRGGPQRVMYTVQPGRRGVSNDPLARGVARGTGARGINAIRNNRNMGGGGGGTFLTGMGDENLPNPVEERRERMRREQQLKLSQASSGQKNLRSRIQAKKVRGKEQTMGQQRHEEAMNELNRRKQELNRRARPNPAAVSVRATKGASAGVHSKNRHMQEFNNIKKGFQKRNEQVNASTGPVRRGMGAPGLGRGDAVGAAGGLGRVASRTAPAARDTGVKRGGLYNPRGAPTTKMGGTATRKVSGAPTRRAPRFGAQSQVPETAPPAVSVSGIKGIRSIRQQK